MKSTRYRLPIPTRTLLAAGVALALAACAAAPPKSTGAAEARAKLTVLQADANLGTKAPVAIKAAEAAVTAAEAPQKEEEIAIHLAYVADRKVGIAEAQARTALAEEERTKLSAQRDSDRLDARTREADIAQGQVASAEAAVVAQKQVADAARTDADAERVAAATHAEELQRQIDDLEAKATERGLVLTLGDVLFTTGKADLNSGATGTLNKLASFLNQYPDRSAAIEGHTDNTGSDDYNVDLSQRRADSVRSYLMGQGIGSTRLAASGMGESHPVAGNESAEGRQQNRRVEVVIDNPPAAVK
jgi:outer membrane protein OmpA-like peptidoglycan-associated protein